MIFRKRPNRWTVRRDDTGEVIDILDSPLRAERRARDISLTEGFRDIPITYCGIYVEPDDRIN